MSFSCPVNRGFYSLALTGFSFAEINFVLRPFYRNHVSYAGLLALFFPLMWFAPVKFPRFSIKWYLFFGAIWRKLVMLIPGKCMALPSAAKANPIKSFGLDMVRLWQHLQISKSLVEIDDCSSTSSEVHYLFVKVASTASQNYEL